MNSYTFRQRCRPRGNYRIKEIIKFLKLAEEAFQCESLYDVRGNPIDLTEPQVRGIMEKAVDKRFPGLGAIEEFFTIPPRKRHSGTVRVEISTGTHPDKPFVDWYDLHMGQASKVPDLAYFKRSIKIFRPFEAFLAEDENEFKLDAHGRLQETRFRKPEIIRGFHYLDAGMVQTLGGFNYVLEAPAWSVDKFCDGVLIQLMAVLFDSSNSAHLRVQENVMDYFNLW
jgi:hypothetical protein